MAKVIVNSDREWAEVTKHSFVPMTVESAPRRSRASVEDFSLPSDIRFCSITAGPSRMASVPTTDVEPVVLVTMQRRGPFELTQVGQAARPAPGEAVVYVAEKEFETVCSDTSECVTVRLPTAMLRRKPSQLQSMLARPIGRDTPAVRVLARTVSELSSVATSPAHDALVGMELVVTELVNALIESALTGVGADSYPREALLRVMQDFIASHLDDPDLSPALVATRHSVSLRYVNTLFSSAGLSGPAGYIRQLRLRRARNLLLTSGLPVHSIARLSGLIDAGTFARAFKREFGVSPSDWRELHRHSGKPRS